MRKILGHHPRAPRRRAGGRVALVARTRYSLRDAGGEVRRRRTRTSSICRAAFTSIIRTTATPALPLLVLLHGFGGLLHDLGRLGAGARAAVPHHPSRFSRSWLTRAPEGVSYLSGDGLADFVDAFAAKLDAAEICGRGQFDGRRRCVGTRPAPPGPGQCADFGRCGRVSQRETAGELPLAFRILQLSPRPRAPEQHRQPAADRRGPQDRCLRQIADHAVFVDRWASFSGPPDTARF